jgi:hypothetical protein
MYACSLKRSSSSREFPDKHGRGAALSLTLLSPLYRNLDKRFLLETGPARQILVRVAGSAKRERTYLGKPGSSCKDTGLFTVGQVLGRVADTKGKYERRHAS